MIYLSNMATFHGHIRLLEAGGYILQLFSGKCWQEKVVPPFMSESDLSIFCVPKRFAACCQDNRPVAAAFHAWRCGPEPSLSADWHRAKASNPKSTCARGASCAAGCAATCFTFIQFFHGFPPVILNQPEFITAIQG